MMIRQILHRLDAFGKAVGSIEFGVVLESLAGINIRPFAKHFLQRLQHEVANFARHGGLGFRIGSVFLWRKRLLHAAADGLADGRFPPTPGLRWLRCSNAPAGPPSARLP